MRVGANDGPRMSPINSALKASPDVVFRDDSHVELALTITNKKSQPKINANDWKATPGAPFQPLARAAKWLFMRREARQTLPPGGNNFRVFAM